MSRPSDFQNKPRCFTFTFSTVSLMAFGWVEPSKGQFMYEITSMPPFAISVQPMLLTPGHLKPFITLISGLWSADNAHKSAHTHTPSQCMFHLNHRTESSDRVLTFIWRVLCEKKREKDQNPAQRRPSNYHLFSHSSTSWPSAYHAIH